MKFDPSWPCECGGQLVAHVIGSERFSYATCSSCERKVYVVEGVETGPIAARLLGRVKEEIERDDFTLGILLSAMAIECEISQMFFKWKSIEHCLKNHVDTREASEQGGKAWEKEYSDWRSVQNKMDNVSLYLTGVKFDDFAVGLGFVEQLDIKYPEFGGYAQIFKLRNRIVHNGEVDLGESQALTSRDYAVAILRVAVAMNREKYRKVF
jgi:hypothetical protein